MLSRDHNRDSSGHSRWKTLLNEFVPWNPGQSLVRSNIFIQEWFSKISTRWKELLLTVEESTELLLVLAAIVNEVIAERRREYLFRHTFIFSKLSTPSTHNETSLNNSWEMDLLKFVQKLTRNFRSNFVPKEKFSKEFFEETFYLLQLSNQMSLKIHAWKSLLFNRITLVRNFS